jgi:osmotically-inducible protein OsmY
VIRLARRSQPSTRGQTRIPREGEVAMKNMILGAAMVLALSGCTSDDSADRVATRSDADNTARNAPQQQTGTGLTATDQSNAPADVETTKRIRQAIVEDDKLSSEAKNVKVITQNGHVTLRGPVDTPTEKAAIESKALQVAGAGRVTSELEVDAD